MMQATDNKLLTQILKKGADVAFKVEPLNDPVLESFRMDTCMSCDLLDPADVSCTVCGCFMDVKTKHKISRNIKKLRVEVTHCPRGKWNDKEVANHYRQIDGLEPLTD
jgi:hypothetical protein